MRWLTCLLLIPVLLLTSTALAADGWRRDPEISWYGPGFYGHRTACGQALTKALLGVAHRTLPCGTLVAFRYQGREVTVPVVDRGPYVSGRQWDLTGGTCLALRHCFTGPIEYRILGGSSPPRAPLLTPPPTDVVVPEGRSWKFAL
jgi:hypothetical protein